MLFRSNDPNSSGYGVQVSCNSLLDKPRALGVPKARMVEPNVALGSPAFMISTTAASPEFGFAAGTYQISISYEDETTGEEGVASDPISVVVPDGGTTASYTIQVTYVHPGYVMPECLAMKINVYIATPNDDALAFYGSFPLKYYTGNQIGRAHV